MKNNSNETIPLARPDISERDIAEVVRVLRTGMLVQGEEVLLLENAISQFLKKEYCSAVSSGTAALHLALLALGIGQGDEVIIPALSHVSTANVVELTGAKCVFVDTHQRYFNIDESKIRSFITDKTKAIIPVHEFGLCANMPEIMKIKEEFSIKIIEDAACALGATIGNKTAGTFGDYGCFSLHPRKAITSGEGGIMITADPVLDKRIKTMRNHGVEPESAPMNFIAAGFNYRLTDFQSALVRSQFKRLPEILEHKTHLAEVYLNEIKNPLVGLPLFPANTKHSWQTFHLLLETVTKRNELAMHLKENGIMTNYGAQCIPAMQYYREKYHHDILNKFPNAYHAYTCGLAVPLYGQLKKEQVSFIARVINNFR